ncbi:MAG TPA: beta-ketoacyl synthase N-terminal-like domain-containing protein, partial [Thermoanaerobaculia bacterium]|nr:beta-ketoacyl synthase N-terminal-like domain-containing protein [Thermoanaerobaculia bacterium]
MPGDLYIGGIGGRCLSLGYAQEPALTAAQYLPSPWGDEPGERLYRTGDRARHWADGTLEFLGRVDNQVKVRGFRIELGEIETVLAGHPGVREAVVLAREDTPGDQRLAAYFIPAGQPAPDPALLRRFLAERLPDYMVPAVFVARASWPLSPTGKLDRQALARSTPAAPTSRRAPVAVPAPAAAPPAAPPQTAALERTLAAVWEEVIGVSGVGPGDNFFDLGGHSMLMVRVQARLLEVLGRELSIVDLFRHPTVGALATFLSEGERADVAPAAAPLAVQNRAVAIVGMAGRFAGAADLDDFWTKLRDGVELIRFFSPAELAAAGVDPILLADPAYVPAKGALAGADLFDAAFFDYSPREARLMDPQQRLFLECAWQALEDAGYGGAAGRAGGVGVFAGLAENTYALGLYADPALLREVGAYQVAIANKSDYLATRVSYKLDLKGPSVNVQTGCSTSLAAVHLACQSLLHGECRLALAGGVSVRGEEVSGYLYEEGSIASPDGHTRAFDAAARGTVSGNGAGVVVLKRLADALADGDTVHAVVLGSAINNDGAQKVGFTAPSVDGQAEVIAQALAAAGVAADTLGYVEGHGTGTALGDPIELAGLTQAFGGNGG